MNSTPTRPAPTAAMNQDQPRLSLRHKGSVLIPSVVMADRFLTRLLGFMGQPAPASGSALYLNPCRSIHTCFMRFPIDVIFLDRSLRVVKLTSHLRPWRIAMGPSTTQSIIELPAGTAILSSIRIADVLVLQ